MLQSVHQPNSGLDYIIGTFTLLSADEEGIGRHHTTDTAWTLLRVSYTNRETDKPAHTQTQIAHTESYRNMLHKELLFGVN